MHNDISFVRFASSIWLLTLLLWLYPPRHHFGTSGASVAAVTPVRSAVRLSVIPRRGQRKDNFGKMSNAYPSVDLLLRVCVGRPRRVRLAQRRAAWPPFFRSAFGSVSVRGSGEGDSGFTGWCLLLGLIILIKVGGFGDGVTGGRPAPDTGEKGAPVWAAEVSTQAPGQWRSSSSRGKTRCASLSMTNYSNYSIFNNLIQRKIIVVYNRVAIYSTTNCQQQNYVKFCCYFAKICSKIDDYELSNN